MALPVPSRTWTITPNNRITFVSLNDTMARYLFGIKAFLVTNGYTVRGSSDGVTGPASGVDFTDRWLTFANVTTRGTAAGTVQSWIILRDGNGVDILLAFQGATDDVARIAYSPNQIYVFAGTPTHQPTATDEVVVTSAATLIGTATTIDRIWHGWVNSTDKLCRFAIMRQGIWVGRVWGIEEFAHVMVTPAFPDPPTRPVWGFSLTPTVNTLSTGVQAGTGRCTVSAAPFSMTLKFGCEFLANDPTQFGGVKPELQGGNGYHLTPLAIGSHIVGARGKAGNLYDWWLGRTTGGADADTYGTLQFISMSGVQGSNVGGHIWPWNGVSTPVLV